MPSSQSPTSAEIRSNKQLNPTERANVIEPQNLPQLPRVVIPAAKSAAPPRVPTGSRILSPRNLSEDFFDMGSVNHVINAPVMHMARAFIRPNTKKEVEYMDVMKEPTLKPFWERGMGNECG
jgi:hypothetical protein